MKTSNHLAPFTRFNHLDSDLNHFLNDIFGVNRSKVEKDWYPQADLAENETAYLISLDLPGLSKSEININLEDGVLTISGERVREEKEEGTNFYRSERAWGCFSRGFRLPKAVDIDGIKANFKNGVLSIEVPKAPEAKPRTITIK